GDDLSLAGFVTAAERHPDVEITACTAHDIAAMQRRFPRIRWLRGGDAIRDGALHDADVWLALGDTPFQLDSGPWLLDHNDTDRRRCAALGKPMYLLGVGCESPAAAADARSVALLAAAERVWTRDALSAATLRPFIDEARLSAGAEIAHLAFGDDATAPSPEPGVTGLLLAFERREQFDLHELGRFVAGRAPGRTRWLVQETRALPYLERWILTHLAPDAQDLLPVMDTRYASSSIEDYLRAFGAPEVTITSRYHGAVVAAWHGSKVLVVSRSAKLRGIAEELDLPQIERAASPPGLEAATASARPVSRERLREIRERAREMCDAFFEECAAANVAGAGSRASGSVASPRSSDPLPSRSLRAAIEADVPRRLRAGETALVRCAVTNRGDAAFVSAPPNPVELCYRWYDARDAVVGAGTWLHTPLPQPLSPGSKLSMVARIAAPRDPGTYTLAVTLLQEGVAWFDDLDPASGVQQTVEIDAGRCEDGDDAFYALSLDERRALTLHAIATGTPLLVRWSTMSASAPEAWQARAAVAAELLRDARCIVDLGCGGMTLERYLAPGQRYVPVDLVARDDRTIVVDVEKDELPAIGADACALLGVLPYLFDPRAVLEKARASFGRAVVSYNVTLDMDVRLGNGWVNHFDYDGVLRLMRGAGFTVVRERLVDTLHYVFELAPIV
ncbi:MAG TPA: hypothetical protein VN224_10395, partial [Xanthomonadales bacterium]|nr:hypothetical protein [Xanthomonadales bacterium]